MHFIICLSGDKRLQGTDQRDPRQLGGWDYYYLWLYKALWNVSASVYNVDRIEDRLDEAPCEGPWFKSSNEHGVNGWASPEKWSYQEEEQNGTVPYTVGIFSGMDYLILHNLYYINNGEGLTPYIDRANAISDKSWPSGNIGTLTNPYSLQVFRSIVSTDIIQSDPTPADISYQAGQNIVLKPGFIAESGSHFHAAIKTLDYCANPTDEFLPEETRNKQYSNQNNSGSRTYWQDIDSYQKEGILVEQLPNESDIKVFPNPAKEAVNITNVSSFDIYEIFDASGNSICKGNIIDEKLVIGVLNYKSGLYLILLRSDDQMIVKRFSVNH